MLSISVQSFVMNILNMHFISFSKGASDLFLPFMCLSFVIFITFYTQDQGCSDRWAVDHDPSELADC